MSQAVASKVALRNGHAGGGIELLPSLGRGCPTPRKADEDKSSLKCDWRLLNNRMHAP
jgi:hypothetical protein